MGMAGHPGDGITRVRHQASRDHTTMAVGADLQVSLYLIPLAAVISLVYSASRYEIPTKILTRAAKLFGQIVGFMAVVFVVLWYFSRGM